MGRFRDFDKYIATFCLGALMVLVVIQITMRVIFLAPVIGAEELVRYLFICVVFMGAPYAARNGGHIRMEEIQALLPSPLRIPIRLLALAGSVGVFAIIAYASVGTMLQNLHNRTATLSIPFPLFILPTVLGFILLTVEYALILFGFLRPSSRGEGR